jgi:hypothetical protein
LVEEENIRYSSLSEPEEVLSSQTPKVPKNFSKFRKHKSNSKFIPLGVPKCIQLVEIMKEAGPRSRRRRQIDGGVVAGELQKGGDGGATTAVSSAAVSDSNRDGRLRGMEEMVRAENPCITPGSGLNLIVGDENSNGSGSLAHSQEGDRDKVVQAAKLLRIQREVGFTFEEPLEDVVKQLVDEENCDRSKKMDWEKRQCDQ